MSTDPPPNRAETDPAAEPGAPSEPATAPESQGLDADLDTGPTPRANAARAWYSVAIGVFILILLIIFIAENSGSVRISFLGIGGETSVALALLASAVAGALIALLVGAGRVLQIRREMRRLRDERRRARRAGAA